MNKIILFLLSIMFVSFVIAQTGTGQVPSLSTVCCEKTTSGLFCQDVPSNECNSNSRQVPTSCVSTSYCKPGFCYDSIEGTVLDNTPQIVCNANNGTWSESFPAQAELGCCQLGDQAAFVSLVRCKRLSAFLGLKTIYNKELTDEVACVLSVQNREKGACVYDFEFEKTCKFTTREDCAGGLIGNEDSSIANSNSSAQGNRITGNAVGDNVSASTSVGPGQFFVGKLCSAEELGTNCAPTKETTCMEGKDEVYFVDSCGNPANIYDASKINDKEYWANMKNKDESCGASGSNANSKSCGNCDYALGSFCRGVENELRATKPTYGESICADLNCLGGNDAGNKKSRHGESWCVFGGVGGVDQGKNSVGSRWYKEICINGEVVSEPCADFRQESCIQDSVNIAGPFSQAACRPNRWQDCTLQKEQTDCENGDRRDCIWVEGLDMQKGITPSINLTTTDSPKEKKRELEILETTGDADAQTERNRVNGTKIGVCLPGNPPGLKFWEGQEAKAVCGQANYVCNPQFEKGFFSAEKCVKDCDCLEADWEAKRIQVCTALGDCGPNVNYIGDSGYKQNYKKIIAREAEEKKFLGIF